MQNLILVQFWIGNQRQLLLTLKALSEIFLRCGQDCERSALVRESD